MTLSEALDIVIARTRHERYRVLCDDDNPDIQQRDAYRRLVVDMAGQPAPLPPTDPAPLIPLADSIRAARLGYRACLYSSYEGCGCSGTHCYHLGRVVGLADCVECLSINRS
jgi:hypothetical protein